MKYTIKDIKKLLIVSNYGYEVDSWFFPSDLVPHSNAFKYCCKKLYEKGLLKRSTGINKYGYQYKISKQNTVNTTTIKATAKSKTVN